MEHSDIEHMAQGYPPSHIGKDHEEVVIELAERVLSQQKRLEASESLMLAMRDDSRESRSKLELVVAENAALKESRKRLGEFILEEIDADYPLSMDVKTPATDAMVNEIRAEGVISFVEHYAGNLRTAGGGDGYHLEPYHDMADHIEAKCELYVDQLRADAAKGGSDD